MTGEPTLAEVKSYLRATSAPDDEISDALAAELAAQASRCRVADPMQVDLAQAVKRRVARNLALRGFPMAVLRGDAEAGDTVLPGRDPEVRRFEAPWRKVTTG